MAFTNHAMVKPAALEPPTTPQKTYAAACPGSSQLINAKFVGFSRANKVPDIKPPIRNDMRASFFMANPNVLLLVEANHNPVQADAQAISNFCLRAAK